MSRIAERIVLGKQPVVPSDFADIFPEVTASSVHDQRQYHEALTWLFRNCLSDPEVPLVIADNVVNYMYGHEKFWDQSNIPPCLPPFPAVFMETANPGGMPFRGPWGALFLREEAKNKEQLQTHVMPAGSVKWQVGMYLLFVDEGDVVSSPVNLSFVFDEEGRMGWDSSGRMDIGVGTAPHLDYYDPQTKTLIDQNIVLAIPFFFTFAFMHCKNVKVERQDVSRQVRRQAERRGERVLRFHTLDIEPMKRVLETEGRLDKVGIEKAMHLCRGHFKVYTADNPLFGKYKGMWFWEAHVRGSSRRGVVVKDYNVNPPGLVS